MRNRGFTLIELLVVLTIIGSLLTIVAPRFFKQVDRATETVLRENIYALRLSIDKYYSDKGNYPPALEALVQERYLRQIPMDPLTQKSDSWRVVMSQNPDFPGVTDIHSGSPDTALDGSRYSEW